MMARRSFVSFLSTILLIHLVFGQDRIDMKCNPSLNHRFEACPKGYCCVRDEFLPSYVYCRKIGQIDENCTTKDSDFECPCAEGLFCKANIVSSFVSLYGRCYQNTTTTTAATTTPTTTTTTTTTTTPMPITTTTTQATITTTTTKQSTTGAPPVTTGDAMKKVTSTSSNVHTTKPTIPFNLPIIG